MYKVLVDFHLYDGPIAVLPSEECDEITGYIASYNKGEIIPHDIHFSWGETYSIDDAINKHYVEQININIPKGNYVVVECHELSDQYECDADRTPICICDEKAAQKYTNGSFELYKINPDKSLELFDYVSCKN